MKSSYKFLWKCIYLSLFSITFDYKIYSNDCKLILGVGTREQIHFYFRKKTNPFLLDKYLLPNQLPIIHCYLKQLSIMKSLFHFTCFFFGITCLESGETMLEFVDIEFIWKKMLQILLLTVVVLLNILSIMVNTEDFGFFLIFFSGTR